MKKTIHMLIKGLLLTFFSYFFSQSLFAAPIPEGIQVYQKNMHLFEEHKQKLASDIYRYYKADNFWEVLRHEFVLPHYEYMPQVQAQINWLLTHQDFLTHSANRAAPYLYYILQQVRKRHLPPELVLLPMMESSYNPFAYSNRGAAGIWQLMPGTATGFGVKQNGWYDGRRDLVTSTKTALDYISYLGNFFGGNWLLAIAAYDTGEGNVFSAIKKNIRNGISTDYWYLPLSQETRDYIPRLMALAIIISNPDRYPILLPPVRNAPYLAQIDIGGQIDLKHAANLAGMSLKRLMHLNPGFNRSSTDPEGPYRIILPIEHVQHFTENLEHTPYFQGIRWQRYRVKLGDTWASIAKRFNTTIQNLRQSNKQLASRLKPGKELVIPQSQSVIETAMHTQPAFFSSNTSSTFSASPFPKKHTHRSTQPSNTNDDIFMVSNVRPTENENKDINTIANTLANLQGKYSLQPGDTLYMVREGDDLEKIAKRFHTDSATILAVNQALHQKSLVSGEKIIIPTHLTQTTTIETDLAASETIYSVKQGDNLEKIAQQFHTTSSAIRVANLLTSNELRQGDRLVIPQVG